MNKKFVYQVGNNKKVILWCTANQISRCSWSSSESKYFPYSFPQPSASPPNALTYVSWCPTNPTTHFFYPSPNL